MGWTSSRPGVGWDFTKEGGLDSPPRKGETREIMWVLFGPCFIRRDLRTSYLLSLCNLFTYLT